MKIRKTIILIGILFILLSSTFFLSGLHLGIGPKDPHENSQAFDSESPLLPGPSVASVFQSFQADDGQHDQEAKAKLVYCNHHAWYARWSLIASARQTIDFSCFMIEKDLFGMALMGALLEKAEEGVRVRIITDDRGSLLTFLSMKQPIIASQSMGNIMIDSTLGELISHPNVEVAVYNPIAGNLRNNPLDLKSIMASDHSKMLIVDKKHSVLGGRNISAAYFTEHNESMLTLRDADVVIKSPLVAKQLTDIFEEKVWGKNYHAVDLTPDDKTYELAAAFHTMEQLLYHQASMEPYEISLGSLYGYQVEAFNESITASHELTGSVESDRLPLFHEAEVKIAYKDSALGDQNEILDEIIKYVDGSQSSIIIQNPYIVLPPSLRQALEGASARGVEIIIQTNSPRSSVDSLGATLTQALFYQEWRDILLDMPTARIFAYDKDQGIHAKTFVFDEEISIVGSFNLDRFSAEICSEVVAIMKSESFAQQLQAKIAEDMDRSIEYKIKTKPDGRVVDLIGPKNVSGGNMGPIKALSRLDFLYFIW